MRTFALRALLAALAAAALAGCGGGSPSDLVLPQDVEVTVRPSGVPGPHSVGLEYVAKSGREITLQLSGLSLEAATGVAFEIRFDNALLEFVGSSPGTFFGADAVTGAAVSENDAAVVVGVAAAADQSVGRSGSGPLITLRFRLRELRDAEDDLVFGTPQSQVYGPAGIAGQHTFTGAILTTRIQAPQ
jgi:hypothetical protein